jgi:3-isopropylmalate dehydrogenase
VSNDKEFKVTVFPGDGIGLEVTAAAQAVLAAVQDKVGGFRLIHDSHDAGAGLYRRIGTALTEESIRAAEASDAILLGACGLPDVRHPDGTEIAPQIDLRFHFNLYAGVRPCKAIPNGPKALADPRADEIDFILIRESTEGLFAARGKGELIDDREARDTMVITRDVSERLFDFAFDLAIQRKARGYPGKVTLIDKANVFTSMAFFRKIFDERAAKHPDIEAERLYVDATALNLIRNPWDYDVMVTENMFGDILSDQAAALVGGMGFAPSADIGDDMAVFQPAHGTAPDIAGKGWANPAATIQSAAMMLDWLGRRHGVDACLAAAKLIDEAMEKAISDGLVRTYDAGGADGTDKVANTVIELMRGA